MKGGSQKCDHLWQGGGVKKSWNSCDVIYGWLLNGIWSVTIHFSDPRDYGLNINIDHFLLFLHVTFLYYIPRSWCHQEYHHDKKHGFDTNIGNFYYFLAASRGAHKHHWEYHYVIQKLYQWSRKLRFWYQYWSFLLPLHVSPSRVPINCIGNNCHLEITLAIP